jgi:hypothetical protein
MEALKMEAPMDNWNDDRLDELSNRVDQGFKETREGFARVDQRFTGVDQRFTAVATREEMSEVKEGIQLVNSKLDRLAHSLMVAGLSFAISMFAAFASLLVALIAG